MRALAQQPDPERRRAWSLVGAAATLAAYALSRSPVPGKGAVTYTLLLFSSVVSGSAAMVPIFLIVSALGLIDTHLAVILVFAGGLLPTAMFILRDFIDGIPRTYEESAMVAGASPVQAFFDVALPVIRPGIVVVVVWAFVNIWGSFLIPFILLALRRADAGLGRHLLVLLGGGHAHRDAAGRLLAASIRCRSSSSTSSSTGSSASGSSAASRAESWHRSSSRTSPRPSAPSPPRSDLNLEIGDGEFVCLLGPSGCGKTTSLRMIAGLESPTSGQILIGGEDVTDLHPKDRQISMVFQDYALYPHMTIADNIAYPLKVRGEPRREAARPGARRWPTC